VLGLVLSINALGNMNLLAHDLGTGFKDFFYRPVEGFIDGPIEGGKGLMIGTASLLGNTAKGTLGTLSKLVNTVSKSLLLLAGDDDYIDSRDQMERPSNVFKGFAFGLKSTVTGVASGVQGIYKHPMQGVKQEGAKGFMKGTFKGLRGVVVKPISGGLDLIMKTTEGASNMVKVGGSRKKAAGDLDQNIQSLGQQRSQQGKIEDELSYKDKSLKGGKAQEEACWQEITKVRSLRPFYGANQRLKQFHHFHSNVALHLRVICNSDYEHDDFLDAIIYTNEQLKICLILTEQRLLIVDAIDKQRIKDFQAHQLSQVKSRPIYEGAQAQAEELEFEPSANFGGQSLLVQGGGEPLDSSN